MGNSKSELEDTTACTGLKRWDELDNPNDEPKNGLGKGYNIIFIHGFGGEREKTWRNNTEYLWPLWLKSTFPGCRIYGFGYGTNSTILENFSDDISGLALSLKKSLVTEKLLSNQQRLIIVAHSLGGIVAKKAIRLPGDPPNLGQYISGILFLATPHLGSPYATIASLGLLGVSSRILSLLRSHDDHLTSIHQEFCQDSLHQHCEIFSFYEQRKYKGALVVNRDSAAINFAEIIPLDEDHISICKFNSKNGSSYRDVQERIRLVFEADKKRAREREYKNFFQTKIPLLNNLKSQAADYVARNNNTSRTPKLDDMIKVGRCISLVLGVADECPQGHISKDVVSTWLDGLIQKIDKHITEIVEMC